MIAIPVAPDRPLRDEPVRRQGFALAAALLSMMLIAALMASVFLAAMEETRIGSVAGAKQIALSAAESAIELTIQDSAAFKGEPIGIDGSRSTVVDGFGTPVVVNVTRLDSALYWLVADAGRVSSQLSATRRIGVLVIARERPDGSIAVDRIAERWWSELF